MDEKTRKLAEKLMELARKNLVRDKDLAAVAFLVNDDGVTLVHIQFSDQAQKEAAYRRLAVEARERHADSIITINDGYVYIITRDKLVERREAISLSVVHRDGRVNNLRSGYTRRDGEIQFDDEMTPWSDDAEQGLIPLDVWREGA